MSKQFNIQDFIDNRWAEASLELERIAPTFVHAFQALDSLMTHGFVLPEGFPAPEQRLPSAWHEVLESSMDVTQVMGRLEITLELMKGNSDLQLARYFYEVWLEGAYALCEKVESLIAHTCKIHSINRKTKRGYHALIKSEVLEEIDKRRTAFVHGANRPDGKVPIPATTMTDLGYWEGAVFLGPQIIKSTVAASHGSGKLSAKDYYSGLTGVTAGVLSRLGVVLERVDQDIASLKK